MSTDFTAPNKPLEEAIAKCKSASELAEVLRLHQDKVGAPQFDNRFTEMPPTSVTPVPVVASPEHESRGTARFYEVLYPRGNDRIEISAHTQAELDSKKAAILAAYGK